MTGWDRGNIAIRRSLLESIPFTETRSTCEAILRNANVYRQLYGEP